MRFIEIPLVAGGDELVKTIILGGAFFSDDPLSRRESGPKMCFKGCEHE